jgi:8-oxo-dGTP pyrophosphatase MutT (NUDIX family)
VPAHNPWTTLAQRLVYENRWIRVREDRVLRPDGREGIFGVVEIRPSVGVVAVNDTGDTVLVGQWRYPQNSYSWEIPRGGSNPGEQDPLVVAARELREEAGVAAERWRPLGAVQVCNGVTDDVQHLYLATGLRLVGTAPDVEEEIAVRWVPFPQAVQMALDGDITEVCSVAALLRAQRIVG